MAIKISPRPASKSAMEMFSQVDMGSNGEPKQIAGTPSLSLVATRHPPVLSFVPYLPSSSPHITHQSCGVGHEPPNRHQSGAIACRTRRVVRPYCRTHLWGIFVLPYLFLHFAFGPIFGRILIQSGATWHTPY